MAVEVVEPGGGDAGAGGVPPRNVLRRFVSEVCALPTGPELMTGLLGVMGRELSAREWVEVTVAWKRLVGFCTAGQLTGVGEVDRALAPDPVSPDRSGGACSVRAAADELAAALRIAPRAASALVGLTRRVEAGMPAALDALAEGRLDLTGLRVVDQVVRDLPAAPAAAVVALAVRRGPRRTAAQLRDDLEVEAQRRDPAHATRAAAAGVAERDVVLRASPLPGCRRLVADLPVVAGTAAWLAVNGAAVAARDAGRRRDGTGEGRSLPQLRADVLTALLTGRTGPGVRDGDDAVPTPGQLARLAEVQVVVPADTLTGAARKPGHVPGVGPVDPGTVRALAARARWRRLVADPATGTLRHADGAVLPPPERGAQEGAGDPRLQRLRQDPLRPAALASPRYRPGSRLRLHVHVRDATCIGVACHHPARGTQLDHTVNHGTTDRHGVRGTTCEHNLGSTCQRTHNAKTHGGWRLRQPRPGTFLWTSPTGRTYLRRARPLLPGRRQPTRDRGSDGDGDGDEAAGGWAPARTTGKSAR